MADVLLSYDDGKEVYDVCFVDDNNRPILGLTSNKIFVYGKDITNKLIELSDEETNIS